MYSLLLVDDDALLVDTLKDLFHWEKYDISPPMIAHSCASAQEIFKEHPVDILICDIEMFGHTGFELLEWVRKNYRETVSSFLTCHARFEYAQRAIDLGAHSYLLKPICDADLEKLLISSIEKIKEREAAGPKNIQKYSAVVQSAVDYIRQHLGESLTRADISQELFISESQLSKAFNKETGVSISEFITLERLSRAKILLAETNQNITQICMETGFHYSAYFTKIFREAEGMTPNQYRQKLRQQAKHSLSQKSSR